MPFQRVITVVLSMLNHHHLVEQQEPMRMDSLPNIRPLCKAQSSTYETLNTNTNPKYNVWKAQKSKKRRRKRNTEAHLIHSNSINI